MSEERALVESVAINHFDHCRVPPASFLGHSGPGGGFSDAAIDSRSGDYEASDMGDDKGQGKSKSFFVVRAHHQECHS
jgi:hypothetical protein